MAAAQVEIAYSTMDLFPVPLHPGEPHWGSGPDTLARHIEDTPFVNYEIFLNDAMRATLRNGSKEEVEQFADITGSFHMGLFADTSAKGRILNGRFGLLPCNSVIPLIRARRILSRAHFGKEKEMPLVLFPEEITPEIAQKLTDESEKLLIAQPAAEHYADAGEVSLPALMRYLRDHSIYDLCPDTGHGRRKGSRGEPRKLATDKIWPQQFASGHVVQMHVAANRWDMAGLDPDMAQTSVEEYKAFLKSEDAAKKTKLGELVTVAVERWEKPVDLGRNVLRMVTEFAPHNPKRRQNPLRTKKDHVRFAENLVGVVESAGATVLTRAA